MNHHAIQHSYKSGETARASACYSLTFLAANPTRGAYGVMDERAARLRRE